MTMPTTLSDGTPFAGQEVLRFTNPNGDYVDLNVGLDSGGSTGSYGRWMPTLQTFEDGAPDQPGSTLVEAQYMPRILNLYLSVPGPSQRALIQRMAKVLNPRLGVGQLTALTGESAGRILNCIYYSGLDQIVEANPLYSYGIVQFKAFNPFWVAGGPVQQVFSYVSTTTYQWWNLGASNKWFPFNLGTDSNIAEDVVIDNIGDVEAWPYVIVTGPGSNLELTNNSTGQTFQVPSALLAGESLTIDMTYGNKTVTHVDALGNSSNWYDRIADGTEMWFLEPGGNDVSIGFITATGEVNFGYLPQYLSQ